MTAADRDEIDAIFAGTSLPLVIDLDGALLKIDTLYELFAAAFFAKPIQTSLSLFALKGGRAEFRRRLSTVAALDVASLPVRDDVLIYLKQEAAAGRELHLATAADRIVAAAVADRFSIFKAVHSADSSHNLKGADKAEWLKRIFPDGFVYAGDRRADLPVWRSATAAIIVSEDTSLSTALRSDGIPVERLFNGRSPQFRHWLTAIRPQQWAKNLIVLVPVGLGWRDLGPGSWATSLAMMLLLCVVASLTYLVNDIADLSADRKHWSKRRRAFASGAIPVRDGLVLVAIALPALCILGLWISPPAGICLIFYVVVTLGYSFGWKRIPVFDTFIIALLFTIRNLIGIAAANLPPSAWLLTFSMFFFFSLALAKRHAEILRAAEQDLPRLEGRGYQLNDDSLTLTFGISAAMASIVIVVIYLVEDVFARNIYTTPAWLWITPIAIFLFSCRIWVLAHRGEMTDDPVAFALRDGISVGLGIFVAIGILLAL